MSAAAELLQKLRNLRRAYARLKRSVPTPDAARAEAQRRFDEVILALIDPVLASHLDELLGSAAALAATSPDDLVNAVKDRRDSILREEARDAQLYGIKRSELQRVFSNFLRNSDDFSDMVNSTAEFQELLTDMHESNLELSLLAPTLPRKKKKGRKRDVLTGSFSILTGSAIVIANTKAAPAFPFSYALGAGSILEGMKKFLGEPADS